MREQEILYRYLGYYPRMFVTGVPVTQEQAKEIIRRTDRFFDSLPTNDLPYLVRVARQLHLPFWEDYKRKLDENPDYLAYLARLDVLRSQEDMQAQYAALDREREEVYLATLRRFWKDHQRWLDAWGYIRTERVCNDWISPESYRPRGWCHPDGRIGHIDHVGKKHVAADVYKDWCLLANAFPYLEIGATLVCEGEEEEIPEIGFQICAGSVRIVDPRVVDVHAGHPPATRGGPMSENKSDRVNQDEEDRLATFSALAQIFGQSDRERPIPWTWIAEWTPLAPRLDNGL